MSYLLVGEPDKGLLGLHFCCVPTCLHVEFHEHWKKRVEAILLAVLCSYLKDTGHGGGI